MAFVGLELAVRMDGKIGRKPGCDAVNSIGGSLSHRRHTAILVVPGRGLPRLAEHADAKHRQQDRCDEECPPRSDEECRPLNESPMQTPSI